MALGAADVDAEEDDRGVVGQVVQVIDAAGQETAGAFAFVGVPRAEQDVLEDPVPALAGRDGGAQVFEKFRVAGVLALEDFIQDAAHVERVLGAFHEAADGAGAPVGCGVLGEGNGLLPRGNAAGQVERDSAEERGVADRGGGCDVGALPVLLHQGVDPGSEGPGRRFRLPIRSLRVRGPRRESAAGQHARRQGSAREGATEDASGAGISPEGRFFSWQGSPEWAERRALSAGGRGNHWGLPGYDSAPYCTGPQGRKQLAPQEIARSRHCPRKGTAALSGHDPTCNPRRPAQTKRLTPTARARRALRG